MFSPNFLQVFLALACFLSTHSVRFVQQNKIHCVYGVTGCPRLWTTWYLVILATLSLPIFYPFSVANAFCADVLSEYAKGKSVWLLEGNKNTQYERYETKQVAKWENNTDPKASLVNKDSLESQKLLECCSYVVVQPLLRVAHLALFQTHKKHMSEKHASQWGREEPNAYFCIWEDY